MIANKVEMAIEVWAAGDAGVVLPPDCDVVYLRADCVDLERTLRALVGQSPRVGLSLDYPVGLDPRHTGVAAADVELSGALLSQLIAFAGAACRHGHALFTVGCHGTLALDVGEDERCTQVVARTLLRFNPAVSLAISAGARGIAVAHHCGIVVRREAMFGAAIEPVKNCEGTAVLPRVDRYRVRNVREDYNTVGGATSGHGSSKVQISQLGLVGGSNALGADC